MGFFDKFKVKTVPEKSETENTQLTSEKQEIKTPHVKVLARYETMLNGVTTGKRQDILSCMGADEKVNVMPNSGRDSIFLEVYTRIPTGVGKKTKKEVMGTIPPKIVKEVIQKYGEKVRPIISKYEISKNKNDNYECFVVLQINKEQ